MKSALLVILILLGFIFISGDSYGNYWNSGWNNGWNGGYNYNYIQPVYMGSVLHPATYYAYASSSWTTYPMYPSIGGFRTVSWSW